MIIFLALVIGLGEAMRFVPDGLVELLFCRVPAELTAAWLCVPLDRETLTYIFCEKHFVVARSCAATGFFAAAFALLLVRRARWCWLAYPLTLAINTLRILSATLLAVALDGTRVERFSHLVLGAILFLATLFGLWYLTERKPHGTDAPDQPLL